VTFTENGILWVFMRVGQCHEDDASLEGPEGSPVDACEASEEVCAALPREAPYPVPDTTTAIPRRTESVAILVILEGECEYRPSYGRGDIGTRLM
jgi:hypothetical protein